MIPDLLRDSPLHNAPVTQIVGLSLESTAGGAPATAALRRPQCALSDPAAQSSSASMHSPWATLIICLVIRGRWASANHTDLYEPLTFAENLYVKLSSACRAIVDIQYGTTRPRDDVMKSMQIFQLDGGTMRNFNIDEALAALTSSALLDIRRQTKVIVHGFNDNARSVIPLELASAYNDKAMFNVLMLDAEAALGRRYASAVYYTRIVGRRLANLLANLEGHGANAEDFHLLGISLGAHVAGWAGKYFRQYKGRRIGRITGLDPAGPCFTYAHSELRLDRRDALYVDVVHSNRLVQGAIEPLGHSDFYVNGGGPHQPGCFTPACSHLRAAQLYTESVRSPKTLVGVKCDNWEQFLRKACPSGHLAVLGYGSSTVTRGRYYLRTAHEPPYGLGTAGLRPAPRPDTFMSMISHLPYA
ncbi:Pancreatic lipase-related protein 2 [Eumeta japonica]|uniref:Pancreatic lipase-related protein 2 n=1 Tax=Eumeta variegata TaxID=151549 RepID=A0A4C1Y231_EUMVA|nr:Pancreatic lipase-related protein 2 [Eumeta japonica]